MLGRLNDAGAPAPGSRPAKTALACLLIALWVVWLGYAVVMLFAALWCYEQIDAEGVAECQRHATSGVLPSFVCLVIATILASNYKIAFALVVALIGLSLALILPR
jgi:hypothetical protein